MACLLAALALSLLVVHESGLSGDEPYYERIAAHPAGAHNFPYAFRVGLPYLVHVLPFSHAFSWELLALLAVGATGGALFALMREFETPDLLAASLCVGLALSPAFLVVLLRNGRGVDIAAVLIITLGCLFVVRRQRAALAATLLVGATIHEACLFLVPLAYAVWADRPLDAQAARDVLISAALPVAAYFYLRTSIVAGGEHYQPGYGGGGFATERVNVLRDALAHGGIKTEARRLALAFGPLWLVAPLAIPRFRFARRGLVLVALCVISMTFALDWGRAIFFAAPIIYVASAWVLKRARRSIALAVVILLLAVDLGYAVYMQVHGVRHGLDSTAPPARGPVE